MKLAIALLLIVIAAPLPILAQETLQKLTTYCETPSVGASGAGENCFSTIQQIKAPAGFVFGEKSYKETKKTTNGGEKGECLVKWDEYREACSRHNAARSG